MLTIKEYVKGKPTGRQVQCSKRLEEELRMDDGLPMSVYEIRITPEAAARAGIIFPEDEE